MKDMSDCTRPSSAVKSTETVEPPSFEELPQWFQDEINSKNDKRGIELDIRASHNRRFKRIVILLGAIGNLMILGAVAHLSFWSLFMMAGTGALCGYLCLRLEPSAPTGILIAAFCNLPVFFAISADSGFTGMAALSFFIGCLYLCISGFLLSMFVTSERLQNLPF